MSNILVTVNEQKLHITQAPTIAAQGVNEDYVVFTLDSYWSGFGIVAFFYRKDDPEHVYQAAVNSSTGKALIPHEVCVEDGVICFGIYGVKNSIIYTSEEQRYRIVKGQYVPNASPSEPITPGIYEQILSLVGGLEQEMAEFISTYSGYGHETTLWTGQKGANGDTFSLSDNASNYDYIDVFYTFSGTEDVKSFLASNFAQGAYIRSTNLSDDSTGTSPLMAAELKITPTTSGNDKNYTINSKRWTWSGEASAAGSQVNPDSTNYQAGYIFKVVGRKRESDSEIINARIGYDGTTYQTAGAAIRTQVSELHSGKQDVLTFDTEPIEGSTNPITSGAVYEIAEEVTQLNGDLSELADGMNNGAIASVPTVFKNVIYSKNDHAVFPYTEYYCECYCFPINPDCTYTISVENRTALYFGLSNTLYSGTNLVVDSYYAYENKTTATFANSNGYKYLYISAKNVGIDYNPKVTQSFRNIVLSDEEIATIEAASKHISTICDKDTAYYTSGYINSATGEVVSGYSYSGFVYTDYVLTNGATHATLVMPVLTTNQTHAGIAFYDSNKTYISGIECNTAQTAGSEVRDIEIPSGAIYLRTCCRTAAWDDFYVKVDDIETNAKNIERLSNIENTCYGLQLFEKIGVISDSISVGWAKDKNGGNSRRNTGISWVQQMARKLGCTAYNLGASGVDPIEWFQSNYEFAQYCYTQYQSVGACDLYIIGLGLNQGTIGSTSDINQSDYTQNGATFYGQYARIIQMINDEHPNAIVMCLTEPTTRISTYDQAVRNICALSYINAELLDLEYDYFDLFNTPEILAERQPDDLHYTPYGYSLIANALMIAINDYISKHTSKFKYVGVATV